MSTIAVLQVLTYVFPPSTQLIARVNTTGFVNGSFILVQNTLIQLQANSINANSVVTNSIIQIYNNKTHLTSNGVIDGSLTTSASGTPSTKLALIVGAFGLWTVLTIWFLYKLNRKFGTYTEILRFFRVIR